MAFRLYGTKTTTPLLARTAPTNLLPPLLSSDVGTSSNVGVVVVVSRTPMFPVLYGAKTTLPSSVAATPRNLFCELMTSPIQIVLNCSVDGLKTPITLQCLGPM
eukprot:2215041-Prymnesium_polylepis.1